MSSPSAETTPALDNHLGWEGWQIDLPADWNPIHFSGSARAGRVIVADLEREQLEFNWRRVRSVDGVDLARLARCGQKDKRPWEEMTGRPIGDVFAQGRSAPADEGGQIAVLVSRVSRRLLFVRLVAPADDVGANQTINRILASLDDRSAHNEIPWCVYGFAWKVPSGFQRSDQIFQAGRSSVTFRKGLGERLTFKRQMIDLKPAEPPPKSPTIDDTLKHATHTIAVHRRSASSPWQRLLRRGVHIATWRCNVANRDFVISAQGRRAVQRVRKAIEGVTCH